MKKCQRINYYSIKLINSKIFCSILLQPINDTAFCEEDNSFVIEENDIEGTTSVIHAFNFDICFNTNMHAFFCLFI